MSEALRLRTFRIGSPRVAGEGVRIGAVRYLPRGVRKADYARLDYFDVWLPQIAPSRELLRSVKASGLDDESARRRFFQRYERELLGGTETRQVLELIRALAPATPLSIGCYCADESRCHRSALLRLLTAK